MGHLGCSAPCAPSHLVMHCRWKAWPHLPHTTGESSPGNFSPGAHASNASRQMPHTSSPAFQFHTPTACHRRTRTVKPPVPPLPPPPLALPCAALLRARVRERERESGAVRDSGGKRACCRRRGDGTRISNARGDSTGRADALLLPPTHLTGHTSVAPRPHRPPARPSRSRPPGRTSSLPSRGLRGADPLSFRPPLSPHGRAARPAPAHALARAHSPPFPRCAARARAPAGAPFFFFFVARAFERPPRRANASRDTIPAPTKIRSAQECSPVVALILSPRAF